MISREKRIPKPTYFGKNLKFLRRLQGKSQLALAREIGLKRNNVASYESGAAEPNTINLLKFCEIFNVDPRLVLEAPLSESPFELVVDVDPLQAPESAMLVDELDALIKKTNDTTLILEGFETFREIEAGGLASDQVEDMTYLRDNIKELLRQLININWKLIQSIYPDLVMEEE